MAKKDKIKFAVYKPESVMNLDFGFRISKGMYKYLTDKYENVSGYLRDLIMKDNKIDEHGKERK